MSAAGSTVSIQIVAGLSGLNTALGQAKLEVQGFASGVNNSLQTLQAPFRLLNNWMVDIAALAAGGLGLREMVKDVNDAVLAVDLIANTLGTSKEHASALRGELIELGLSTETYTDSVAKLLRTVRTNEAAVNAVGVATRGYGHVLLSQEQIMNNALASVAAYKQGTDRNEASQLLFGRSGIAVQQMLRMNSSAMQQATEDVKALGLEMTPENVLKVNEYRSKVGQLSLVFEGIKTQIVDAMMPSLEAVATWFRDNGPAAMRVTSEAVSAIGAAFNFLTPIFDAVKNGLVAIYEAVEGSGNGWQDLGQILLTIAKIIREVLVGAINWLAFSVATVVIEVRTGFNFIKDIVVDVANVIMTTMSSAGTVLKDAFHLDWGAVTNDIVTGTRRITGSVKDFMSDMKRDGKNSAEQIAAAWNKTMGTMFAPPAASGATPTGKKSPFATDEPAGSKPFTYDPKAAAEAEKIAEAEAQAFIRANQIIAQDKTATLEQLRQMGANSIEEELDGLKQLENERHGLVLGELQQELDRVRNNPVEYAKVNGQIEVEEAEHQSKLDEIRRKGIAEYAAEMKQRLALTERELSDEEQGITQKRQLDQISVTEETALLAALEARRYQLVQEEWQKEADLLGVSLEAYQKNNMDVEQAEQEHQQRLSDIQRQFVQERADEMKQQWAPLTDSFNSALESMLNNQMTFWQAMRHMWNQFVISSIMSNLKRLENWIFVEHAQTAATVIGSAARTAAQTSGDKEGILSHIGKAIQHIGTDAAQAFADVFAWASPAIGPFAAIPAAAAFVAVLGAEALIPSFDVGAWNLPSDTIAKVHKGETILAPDDAADYRAMMSRGGFSGSPQGGDTSFTYNPVVHAYDQPDLEVILERQGRTLMAWFAKNMRNGVPVRAT